MAKFRVRTNTKGKRWQKGCSSSSNPSTTKFRDAAKSGFFQENIGNSNLTQEALQKHNVIAPGNCMDTEAVDADAISLGGKTFKTFDTFASDWSQCSNQSFSKLITHFKPDNAVHKELLAVLAAVTEVIKENGGTESSTEYFAALMTALDSEDNDDSSVHCILTLLSMGIKSVPASVLQLKFSHSCKVLMNLLAKFAQSENVAILRPILGCLSVLLRAQDSATWSDSSTLQALDCLLAFVTFSKPKVRKAAQHSVAIIARHSQITEAGLKHIAQYCINIIESVTTTGITAVLHVLALMKDVMHNFPKKELKGCCECVLKVMSLNNVLVTSCSLQALHGMLSAGPSADGLPPQRNARLITALYDYQPPPNDIQPTLAWLATLQQAHCNLAKNEVMLCLNGLEKLARSVISLYLTEKSEVMSGATHTLVAVFEECLSGPPSSLHVRTVSAVATHLTDCLSYQYHHAWTHIIHLLAALFKAGHRSYAEAMLPSLRRLGELRDSNQFAYNNEVDNAVGCAIKSLGPEMVMKAIPLNFSTDDQKKEFKRSWLLPVLKSSIQKSELKFFVEFFLPQAMFCRKESEQLKEKNDQIGSLSFELLHTQIWSLLASFANEPTDLSSSFPNIAKALGGVLSSRKEIRMPVLTALRKLVSHSLEKDKSQDIQTMAKFAKNYIPIFFIIYTTPPKGTDEEGTRLAALETIKVYLKVADEGLCKELFQKAFEKINDGDSFKKESVLDLLRALIYKQDIQNVTKIYQLVCQSVTDKSNQKLHKKYFRLMEEICTSESEACKEFTMENLEEIKNLLLNSLSQSSPNSKGARLRCVVELVRRWPNPEELVTSVIPEAVLCVKDMNSKCRDTAYALLAEMADRIQPELYLTALMAGLAGNPCTISCSLLSLAAALYHFKDRVPKKYEDQIVYNVGVLAVCSTREVVTAALSFIKVYLQSQPRAKTLAYMPSLINIFCKMSDDCKRGCRTKVRDLLARLVRWFGGDTVLAAVPHHDQVLRARVKNLAKIHARRRKEKEAGGGSDQEQEEFSLPSKAKSIEEILAESDSDIDMEQEDNEKPKKKTRGKAWISESKDEIIDFTDASTAKKISASRPVKTEKKIEYKKKVKEFKTAPDGRLIIADNDDSEDEKRPKKMMIPGLDSDDDYEPSDDEAKSVDSGPTTSKPRKRTLSVSTTTTNRSKYVAGGTGIHRPLNKMMKKQKSKKGDNKGPKSMGGKEFKAKKAGGDMKKKGKPDPYAYIPLRRDALNKRKKMKAAGSFNNLMKSARKGAKAGSKQKMKRK